MGGGSSRREAAQEGPAISGPVCRHHFQSGRILGKGGFGVVRAMKKTTGKDKHTWYAVKEMKKKKIVKRKSVKEVFNERDFLKNLNHPFICNAYYGFQDEESIYLVMDIAVGGDLRFHMNHVTCSGPLPGEAALTRKASKRAMKENLKRRNSAYKQPFPEERARWYIFLIAHGLKYLHEQRIIHRDLKPRNILMLPNGYLKITDFGLSVQFASDDQAICRRKSGTSGYRAPEIYKKSHEHSFASDYFPLGVMLHQFWKCKKPFEKESEFHKKMSAEGPNEEIDISFADNDTSISSEYKDIMKLLLKIHPEERIGFRGGVNEILEHTFFSNLTSSVTEDELLSFKTPAPWVPFEASLKNIYAEIDASELASLISTGGISYESPEKSQKKYPDYSKEFEGYDFQCTCADFEKQASQVARVLERTVSNTSVSESMT